MEDQGSSPREMTARFEAQVWRSSCVMSLPSYVKNRKEIIAMYLAPWSDVEEEQFDNVCAKVCMALDLEADVDEARRRPAARGAPPPPLVLRPRLGAETRCPVCKGVMPFALDDTVVTVYATDGVREAQKIIGRCCGAMATPSQRRC